jgi:hypothetical protein
MLSHILLFLATAYMLFGSAVWIGKVLKDNRIYHERHVFQPVTVPSDKAKGG